MGPPRSRDLSAPPATRYRVVERDRRLVVLDTHHGNAEVTQAMPAHAAPRPTLEGPTRGAPTDLKAAALALRADSGQPILETKAWFDDKAPRRILLHDRQQGRLGLAIAVGLIVPMAMLVLIGWPVVILIGLLVFHPGTRKAIRRGITLWLDQAGQEIASRESAG